MITTSHAVVLRAYMRSLGARGGKSRSERKIAAGRINAAKATAARRKKK